LISHAKKQKKNFLPKGFDKTKVNIAIFNSSIDEYEVFEEYKNPIYKDDYDSLVKIMVLSQFY